MEEPPRTPDPPLTQTLKLRRALYDRTTGLPALSLLFDPLSLLLERHGRAGVIHVEVTQLRLIEALHGWQALDRILSALSERLRRFVDEALPQGSLVGVHEIGGERFVAFTPPAPEGQAQPPLAETAEALARELQQVLAQHEPVGFGPRPCAFVGHAWLWRDPFYRFERQVYAVLEEARRSVEVRERAKEQLWGAQLRRIVHERSIRTVFQPVVDLLTGGILGFEALARGPQDTDLEAPGPLFALSSRMGLELDLDRVCRELALDAWGRQRPAGKVFVNASPAGLADPAWLREVPQRLAEAALTAADLVIEISERIVHADLTHLERVVEALRGQGFAVALDDVGTGYGTIATLERVHPEFIKLDRSLIQGIEQSFIKQELLASLVQIGHRLGACLIAEGIESEAQVAAVRAAGARYGQGFWFARPSACLAGGGGAA